MKETFVCLALSLGFTFSLYLIGLGLFVVWDNWRSIRRYMDMEKHHPHMGGFRRIAKRIAKRKFNNHETN